MQEITILSGKGGTGKTSITAALASVAKNAVFCDNDVDAADLHLLFHPQVLEQHDFDSGWVANINTEKCDQCNICIDHCRFDAINKNGSGNLEVNPFACEGCRLCERVCPKGAITSKRYMDNQWFVSDTRFGKLIHAHMGPGQENSGKLVSQIRKKAKELANEQRADFIVNDGPPGIGCPVIASVTGTDKVLLVVEPSISGLHDAQRVSELVKGFGIPQFAVINKYDLHPDFSKKVERFLVSANIPLVGKIPFDSVFVDAMVAGETIVEYQPKSEIAKEITSIWRLIFK